MRTRLLANVARLAVAWALGCNNPTPPGPDGGDAATTDAGIDATASCNSGDQRCCAYDSIVGMTYCAASQMADPNEIGVYAQACEDGGWTTTAVCPQTPCGEVMGSPVIECATFAGVASCLVPDPTDAGTCSCPMCSDGGGCVDLSSDPNNCGQCGMQCDSGGCASGACAPCTPGATQCCVGSSGGGLVCGASANGCTQEAIVFTRVCEPSGQWAAGSMCGNCEYSEGCEQAACSTINGRAYCMIPDPNDAGACQAP